MRCKIGSFLSRLACLSGLLAFGLPEVSLQAQKLPSETPRSADAFVDSIGINVHLHNGNTLYGDFPTISKALQDLGVRHTRDGLINTTWEEYYRRHIELMSYGIHCLFITGPEDTDEQIRVFIRRMSGAVEGLEAPNEYDRTGGAKWAEKLMTYMPRLKAVATESSAESGLPVIGPALTTVNGPASLAQLAASFDEANMHNYFGGHHPGTSGWGDNGYGSIDWNLKLTRKAWGAKPIVTTETGYLTDTKQAQSIPEEVQAIYTPRIFLEQAMHGVQRTYLYELADGNEVIPPDQRSFGLLRNDGSRKPAFVGLQRLIEHLKDEEGQPDLRPVALDVLPGADGVSHMLFRNGDGSYCLAVWLEVSSYDQEGARPRSVLPVDVTVETDRVMSAGRLFSLDPKQSAMGREVGEGKSVTLAATGYVSLLEFQLGQTAVPKAAGRRKAKKG